MLNGLWGAMILVALVWAAISGNWQQATESLLAGGGQAVTLTISTIGVMAFWMGMMELAKEGGLMDGLTKAVRPLLRRLFPAFSKDHPALQYMAVNFTANFLGLGAAATPAGLKAMEAMDAQNPHPGRATKEMCLFLIINMSSVELMCMNVIAYRAQSGSVSPMDVVLPTLFATTCSTLTGILAATIFGRWEERKEQKKNRGKKRNRMKHPPMGKGGM